MEFHIPNFEIQILHSIVTICTFLLTINYLKSFMSQINFFKSPLNDL